MGRKVTARKSYLNLKCEKRLFCKQNYLEATVDLGV